MHSFKKFLKWWLIICVISILVGMLFSGHDKINNLRGYIEDGNYKKAHKLIEEMDNSYAADLQFVSLKAEYYSDTGDYDEAANVLLEYYWELRDRTKFSSSGLQSELDALRTKTSEDVSEKIEQVANEIEELLAKKEAEQVAANKEREAEQAAANKKERDSNFENALSVALTENDSETIMQLYESDLDENQRVKLLSDVDESYLEWVENSYDDISLGSKDDMIRIYKGLKFLEKTSDSDFIRLKNLRVKIKELYEATKQKRKINYQYGEEAQYVDSNQVEDLDVYVYQRIESAFHINLGGIDITDKYTDQFQIMSYENLYGVAVPNGDWQAVITFKEQEPLSRGTLQTKALYVGTEEFIDEQGFVFEIPVYIEVTQADLDYSNQVTTYENKIDYALTEIQKIIK